MSQGYSLPLRRCAGTRQDQISPLPWSYVYAGNVSSEQRDDEPIAFNQPQNLFVGQPRRTFTTMRNTWGQDSGQAPKIQIAEPKYTHPKRSPSEELLKIDDLYAYVEACMEYSAGVKAGWTDDQLLDMIGNIRGRPSKEYNEAEAVV